MNINEDLLDTYTRQCATEFEFSELLRRLAKTDLHIEVIQEDLQNPQEQVNDAKASVYTLIAHLKKSLKAFQSFWIRITPRIPHQRKNISRIFFIVTQK